MEQGESPDVTGAVSERRYQSPSVSQDTGDVAERPPLCDDPHGKVGYLRRKAMGFSYRKSEDLHDSVFGICTGKYICVKCANNGHINDLFH